MRHRIYEPSHDLADFVKCYWTLESPKEQTPERNTIVPDGCMKMIFHYKDLYRHYPACGDSIVLPRCFVVGQLTRPYEVEPIGETGTFFVVFHPYGFLPFAKIPIRDMENRAVPLEDLFGIEGTQIGEKILNASSNAERIEHIERFLLNRSIDHVTIDSIVNAAVANILKGKGQVSVDELSRQININRRQLVRKFSSSIGLSPKQLSKTIRLQATLKVLLNKEITHLIALAYESAYYDQAHFIKEFKEFTGLTPKEFYGDNLKMSLVFDRKE